jgi:hypothetical protein
MGQTKEALDYFQKSVQIDLTKLPIKPDVAPAPTVLFISYYQLGCTEQFELAYPEARSSFAKALILLEEFKREGRIGTPDATIGTWSYRQWFQAIIPRLEECEKAEEVVNDIEFAFKQPKDQVPGLLNTRLDVLIKRGDLSGAVITAEAFAKLADKEKIDLYNAACNYALCSGLATRHVPPNEVQHQQQSLELALKAMDLLRQAVAAGYNDIGHMKQDNDLNVLRMRDEFQKLIAELEAKQQDTP